jgi:dTDP-4-dehydrorhamnose 3,5-epimerase
MIFRETGLAGLMLVELEPISDERGSFARTFDSAEWEKRGMSVQVVQCNLSRNLYRGTLRGMHYQEPPHSESKLVRCSRGAIFDVAVDIRRDSPTFRRWFGIELSDDNGRMLHIPEGFAHGFLTLTDGSEVLYQMSACHSAVSVRGIRWDDPAIGIEWPASPLVISERDRGFPDFEW